MEVGAEGDLGPLLKHREGILISNIFSPFHPLFHFFSFETESLHGNRADPKK